MTDQQLHERAQKFADDHQSWVPDEQSKGAMYNAFLAGASSVQVGGWVNAKNRLPSTLYRGQWRDANTKSPISHTAAYSAIKTDQKEFVEWLDESTSSSEPVEDDAISFAEWVDNRATRNDETGLWIHCLFEPNEPITSQQLYELFKQRK